MNLRDLAAQEMVTISGVLLDPAGQAHAILKATPVLAGSVLVLRQAHERLLKVTRRAGTNEKRARELTAKLTKLDALHDRKARGIYRVIEACADLAESSEEALEYQDLLEVMFPLGLAISQRSYREQAGTAAQIAERLGQAERDRLSQIQLGARTLLDETLDWLETARQIGAFEAERALMVVDDSDDAVSAAEVRDGRIFWVQAMHAFVQMVAFTDLDQREQHILLANLKDADRKATLARRRAEAGGDAGEGGDGEVVEPESPAVVDVP